MKRRSTIGICLLVGLSFAAIDFAQRVIADEPLPDASVLAYRGRGGKRKSHKKPPKPPTVSEVTLTGVVNDVQLNGVTITASKGGNSGSSGKSKSNAQKQWFVTPQADTAVTIHGTAMPDYLRQGQIVEFTAQIIKNEKSADKPSKKSADESSEKSGDQPSEKTADEPSEKSAEKPSENSADKPSEKTADEPSEKSADEHSEKVADEPGKKSTYVFGEKVADKLKELTIVARKRTSIFDKGSVRDRAAVPGVGAGRIEVPKAEADADTTLTIPDDNSKVKTGKGGTADAKPEAAASGPPEKILGRIVSCNEKSLTVTVGPRAIHADLADVPTIYVEISDPKVVQAGSKLKIEGPGSSKRSVWMMASDMKGSKIVVHGTGVESKTSSQCMAKSIDVTLAAPLTGNRSMSFDAKKPLTAN